LEFWSWVLKVNLRHLVLAAAVAGGAAIGLPPAAMAADLPSIKSAPDVPATPDWIVTLSGEIDTAPQYPGANRFGIFGAPGINIRQFGTLERFSTPDDGFGVALYNTDLLRVGPVGRFVGDRSVYHHRELAGLSYMEPSLELGGFAELTPLPWLRARAEVRQAITGHDGLVATLGGDVWQKWGKLTVSVGPRLNFGNDKFADAYFAVSPAQAVANNLAGGNLTPYTPRGGLTSAGGLAAIRYDFNETWRATGFAGYQRLAGSVSGSPIVQLDGSRDQYTIGIEFAYSFRTAPWFGF
jgi:outer membrane scaffolding protein for murein synthesis (MipA/OmpV family)